jgi:two-component system, cell cycle response regulator
MAAKSKDTLSLSELLRTVESVTPELPSRSETEACLVYIYPKSPLLGKRYSLDNDVGIIGRADENLIANPDASVSRKHARIDRLRNGQYQVVDLNSTNGTYINNQPIKTGILQDGDYLRVGNCIYRFLMGGNVETEYHEEIYRLTVMDPLTGTHNRRSLLEFLEREMSRSLRYRRPLSIIMFDIDHFKKINDEHGHLAGDLTLKETISRIRPDIRQDEMLARYGGEEFAVVLPEVDTARACKVAERVRFLVGSEPYKYQTTEYQVTVSLGVGTMDGTQSLPATELIRLADEKLYEAKRTGRNRVCS